MRSIVAVLITLLAVVTDAIIAALSKALTPA